MGGGVDGWVSTRVGERIGGLAKKWDSHGNAEQIAKM